MPDSKPVDGPRRRRRDAAHRRRPARHRRQRQRLPALPQRRGPADRRRRTGRRRPHPLRDARPGGGTEVAQTPELRASYPRSSDDLIDQETYDTSLAEFSSKGRGLAVVDIEDLPDAYATEAGIKLEWPTYKIGVERWRWFLPAGPPAEELVLPFTTVWRATKIPAVEVSCTVTTSAGDATVETAGAMGKLPGPIDEG